jgi:hypothetical protein
MAADGTDASVTFGNQTATNGTVSVDVVLPEGGYVVVHSGRYVFDERPAPVAATSYLPAGEHTVAVELDASALPTNATGRLAAVAHRDTGGDERLTRYEGNLSADPPYSADGEPVDDVATVTDPAPPAVSATTSAATPRRSASAPTTTTTGASGGPGLLDVVGVGLGVLLALAAAAVLLGGRR